MDYKIVYENWLSNPKLNKDAFSELNAISGDEKGD